jgi:hypothetical protein
VTEASRSRVERVLLETERRLSVEEIREYLDHPVTEAEREDVLALVAWFRRCYPTPLERLEYVRRAYDRWRRTIGGGSRR